MTIDRLLLDTNLLLLWIVGNVARDYIPQHKRLKAFSGPDFDYLKTILAGSNSVTTTVNAWTEVTNIIPFGVRPPLSRHLLDFVRFAVQQWPELYHPSRNIVEDGAFMELGLADGALLSSLDNKTTLLTTDAPLYWHALARGHRAFNFHHLREERGLTS